MMMMMPGVHDPVGVCGVRAACEHAVTPRRRAALLARVVTRRMFIVFVRRRERHGKFGEVGEGMA